ncbi:MAG: bifunctional 2-polyprenyl-6-hydroxyphenol methylase/3-demethylubiquinol 3-O-methyltransferase UbiG [Endozoicomonadaceae bacterium]|nr:bifunctional 2-polyprenyl-6-hydroxyphenol methylase/3-demethylubiquinol 3-O-methyltransferase UbiG [Endozoicomonadaceae bacterium]
MPEFDNVDPDEINKFDHLSSKWWDPHGAFKPLHDLNPIRLNYIDSQAILSHKTVLDVGCGGGILSEAMALRGAEVTGIDLAEKSLQVAREHSKKTGVSIEYQCLSAERLSEQESESFDIITCLEMLEHVPDPEKTIQACAKLVKPDGHLFFSTLNKTLKSWLFAIIGAEYILKLLPKGTHDWHQFIPPHQLVNYCEKQSLTLCDMTGITYNPFTKQYQLNQQDLSVNYLIHTKKTGYPNQYDR